MISPQDAAREVMRRRRARESLVAFSQAITIPGAPVSSDEGEWLFKPIETAVARHHKVTMEAIERCIRTPYGRLMIFEPPGSAKSTYASVVGPAWAMGSFPGIRVLMCGYASTPIVRHSKRARQIARSKEYSQIWNLDGEDQTTPPPTLTRGGEAADEWELSNGSGLFAAGLQAGITSSRCDLGIIDDPVAGRKEADSEADRANVRQAYEDDFLTRLKPEASIILIQTRWNQDDLAGGILPEDYDGRSGPVLCRDGQVWEILNIPAKCEHRDDPVGRELGEYLWPEWFAAKHWAIFSPDFNPRANVRTWSCLYQQRPTADEGIHFKRGNFKRFEALPPGVKLRFYMASDLALTEKQTGGDAKKKHDPDYSVHLVAGVDPDDNLWIVDGYREREELDRTAAAAIPLIRTWRPVMWFGEKGGAENAAGPYIRDAMRLATRDGEPAYAPRHLLPSVEDKIAKAAAFGGRVSAGKVYVIAGSFGDTLIDELCVFPGGRKDDQVDACGMFGRGLDMIVAASKPAQPKDDPIVPFTRRHFEAIDYDEAEREQRKRDYYR